jgi:hypothetical protein
MMNNSGPCRRRSADDLLEIVDDRHGPACAAQPAARVRLPGRAGTKRGIVHPAELCTGQRPRWARPDRQQEIAMTHDHAPFLLPDTETDDEPHASSPTAHLLDELALYGYRPGQDEPDPRPLPENETVRAELGAIVL